MKIPGRLAKMPIRYARNSIENDCPSGNPINPKNKTPHDSLTPKPPIDMGINDINEIRGIKMKK